MKIVFNDIDGCFGKFQKPKTYPERQCLEGHMEELERIRQVVDTNPNVRFAACTGRSLFLAENIIDVTGMNELSPVEMGQVIYNPLTQEAYDLVGLVKPELAAVGSELKRFIADVDRFEEEVMARYPGIGVKRMKDNTNMLTYEFEEGKIAGKELFDFFETRLPGTIRDAYGRGDIKLVTCSFSFDFRLDLDKGHAMDHVLGKLEVDGSECLGIGDSYHSDMDMMERCGYVACPANSGEDLKEYVRRRRGYVAKAPFAEGVLEIYREFL